MPNQATSDSLPKKGGEEQGVEGDVLSLPMEQEQR